MTPEEGNLISGLFDRLRTADTAAKDRDAEQLIQAKVAAQPSAPYLLSQTVLVQEHALANAQARIADLEKQLASAAHPAQPAGGGGFLSSLFHPQAASIPTAQGAPNYPPQPPPPAYQPTPSAPPPYPSTVGMPASAGGGFLRSALTTAAGVAGGSLLFQGIESLLGHNAGAFGSSLGGFGGSGFSSGMGEPREIIENREVVNNYYGNEPGQGGQQQFADAEDQQFADAGANQDAGAQDVSDDQLASDLGLDSGDSGGGGGDDSLM